MEDYNFKFVQPNPTSVVVLERIADAETPEYCIHGKTRCLNCNEWCWLGSETYSLVSAGGATPLCLDCAKVLLKDQGYPARTLFDHR